eukprot:jgi/Galph1/199/GphlegSOOS_G4900.1
MDEGAANASHPAETEYIVESDPTGRYVRSNVELGRGAYKTVYKAFDKVEALEVAWNKLHTERFAKSDICKVLNEVELLRKLKHKNILEFHAAWQREDVNGRTTCDFITELMTSGTLKEYIKRAQTIKVKVIRRWGENILEAIEYLHTQNPPIMHRDLKCDNIFINGNSGTLKVGDLGLSAVRDKPVALSVLGTPEFMAPELYEEKYSEKVDIYAFGMCLLEMVTMEYPYSECKNAAQIFRKVMSGEKPVAFHRLKESEMKRVIAQCLLPEKHRPSASDLLHLDLFAKWEGDDGSLDNRALVYTPEEYKNLFSIASEPASQSIVQAYSEARGGRSLNEVVSTGTADEAATKDIPAEQRKNENVDLAHNMNRNVIFHGDAQFLRPIGDPAVELLYPATSTNGSFRLCLQIPVEGSFKKIEFDYDPENDSPESLAEEMVVELNLKSSQLESIKEEIEKQMVRVLHSIPSTRQESSVSSEEPQRMLQNYKAEADRSGFVATAHETINESVNDNEHDESEVVPIVIVGSVSRESYEGSDSEQSTIRPIPEDTVIVPKQHNSSPQLLVDSRRKAMSDGDNGSIQSSSHNGNRDPYAFFIEDSDIEDVGLGFSLMEAVARGDTMQAQKLLEKGAPITYFDYDRRTPLHVAASEGNVEVAKLLVERGASTEARDRWGSTPVLEALVAGHKNLAKMLRNASRTRSWMTLSNPSSARSQGSLSPNYWTPRNSRTPRVGSLTSQQAMSAEDLVGAMYGYDTFQNDDEIENSSIREGWSSRASEAVSPNSSYSPPLLKTVGKAKVNGQTALTKKLDALNVDVESNPLAYEREQYTDSDEEEELRRLEEAFLKELLDLERKRQQAILELRQRLSEKRKSSSASLKDVNISSSSCNLEPE